MKHVFINLAFQGRFPLFDLRPINSIHSIIKTKILIEVGIDNGFVNLVVNG